MTVDLNAVAQRATTKRAYWLEDADGDWCGSEDFCRPCAEKKAKAAAGTQVFGPLQCEESDGCRHCATCGVILHYVLTQHGVREEMDHFNTYGVRYPLSPEEAYHLQAIEDQLPHMKISWMQPH